MPQSTNKQRLVRRLRPYWKMEFANIFLLPLIGLYLIVFVFGAPITTSLCVSTIATSWLLILGTISLRMMLEDLQGNKSFGEYWLPKLNRAQLPSLMLVTFSCIVTLANACSVFPNFSASHYGSLLFSLLALLEYINYYHRQLQHFDNAADFQRLREGRGFRRSHLSCRLERWRRMKNSKNFNETKSKVL
jgi:hypothetical protein